MVSIIIPIYNSERTLERCFGSISKQSYSDIEVLMINDGSTDNSDNICKNMEKKDARFHYFYQKNSGVSKARNLGLEKASGDWITFVDADDWIEESMVETLVKYSSGVDIIGLKPSFDGNSCHEAYMSCKSFRKKQMKSFPLALLVPEASAYYDNISLSIEIIASVCGKMVRKQLLTTSSIYFKEDLPLGEDGLFWMKCYFAARDFLFIDKVGYHYVIDEGSSNYRLRPNVQVINQCYFNAYLDVLNQVPLQFQAEFLTLLRYRMYSNLRNLYLCHKENNDTFNKRYKKLKIILKDYELIKVPYLSLSKKIELFFLRKKMSFGLLMFGQLIICIKSLLRSK